MKIIVYLDFGCNSSVLLMGIINLNMYLRTFHDIQGPDKLLASKISGIHLPLIKQVPCLWTFDKRLFIHLFLTSKLTLVIQGLSK
jgi:hypothetical protein